MMKLLPDRCVVGVSSVSSCFSWAIFGIPEDHAVAPTLEQVLAGDLGPVALRSFDMGSRPFQHRVTTMTQELKLLLAHLVSNGLTPVQVFVENFERRLGGMNEPYRGNRLLVPAQDAACAWCLTAQILQVPPTEVVPVGLKHQLLAHCVAGKNPKLDGVTVEGAHRTGSTNETMALCLNSMLPSGLSAWQRCGSADAICVCLAGIL